MSTRIRKCPLCGRAATLAERPFCSPACRNRDLLAWASEAYRAPGPPADAALDSLAERDL